MPDNAQLCHAPPYMYMLHTPTGRLTAPQPTAYYVENIQFCGPLLGAALDGAWKMSPSCMDKLSHVLGVHREDSALTHSQVSPLSLLMHT